MKNREKRIATILGTAIAAGSENQPHRTFSRAQILMLAVATLLTGLLFCMTAEAVEVWWSNSQREAIEAAAILRVCPPLRMPAQLAAPPSGDKRTATSGHTGDRR